MAELRTVDVSRRSSSGATIRLNGGPAYQLTAAHVSDLARLFKTLEYEETPVPGPDLIVTVEDPS